VDEPVRTEVVEAKDLRRASSDGGVLTALAGTTGLNTRPCALCGSAGVGMQGLDPSYTEISIDGLPVLSGVGALYGLDAIAVQDLKRLELVKGSGNSHAGAAAMAGSVNLVTAEAREHPTASVTLSGGGTLRHMVGGDVSAPVAGVKSRASLTWAAEPRKLDRNGDDITDTPQFTRLNGSLNLSRDWTAGELRAASRLLHEERFAGETAWNEEDQGSSRVYGRDIHTRRYEGSLRWNARPGGFGAWSLESALAHHRQDSWYGSTRFDATQLVSTSRLAMRREWNPLHSSHLQLQYRHEDYADNLSLAHETDRTFRVPGAVVRHSWDPDPRWFLQGGLLAEHYQRDGMVFTPRASLRLRPTSSWTLLASGGTGYRPVTIFSLDKAVHAGFDNVVVPENLQAERSANANLSLNYRSVGLDHSWQMDLTGFYTSFRNKVVLAFQDHAAGTIYSNADDAFSRGVELRFSLNSSLGWTLRLGGTLTDAQYRDSLGWHRNELQNIYTANGSIERRLAELGLTADMEANLYGPQPLPEGRSRDQSPTYATVNLGVAKDWGRWTVSASVDNLFDYTQPDNPLITNPSTGERRFDSAMIYGPLLGRVFLVGLRGHFGAGR
jgi:outer membrane receptor for ferrienterochelin and colicins